MFRRCSLYPRLACILKGTPASSGSRRKRGGGWENSRIVSRYRRKTTCETRLYEYKYVDIENDYVKPVLLAAFNIVVVLL